jgi:hypothetical protein
MNYSYLLEKIRSSAFSPEPFKHIYIRDLFSEGDFAMITSAPEIAIHKMESDAQPSPHFAGATTIGKKPVPETASANFFSSGVRRCSGMFGINS